MQVAPALWICEPAFILGFDFLSDNGVMLSGKHKGPVQVCSQARAKKSVLDRSFSQVRACSHC